MRKKIIVSLLIVLFAVSLIPSNAISIDSNQTQDKTNSIETPTKQIINKNMKEQKEYNGDLNLDSSVNLLETSSPEICSLDYEPENELKLVEKQSVVPNIASRIKLAVNDTSDVINIYYQRLTEEIVTHGLPDETLEIHVIVKGLILTGDRLNIQFRRDVVNWPDSDLYNGYYEFGFDLLGDETFHVYATVTLDPNLSDFGYGTGDIRSYFLIIYLDSGPTLFDGSNMNELYRLWMYGHLELHRVQYYNYTTIAGNVETSYAVPGWQIFVRFYFAVADGPVWDFDIQGTIKADKKWAIDETLYSDDEKLIDWILEPGLYYYDWSDSLWNDMNFTVPVRSYGNLPGDTRALFGVLFEDGYQVDSINPDDTRDELNIIPNTVEQPPQVQIELPLDGYVTYNTTLSLNVEITDPNSNYDIVSVEVLVEGSWLDGTGLYNPTMGRFDVYVTNAFTSSGIKNITVKAEDSVGNVGYDSVVLQYLEYGFFFPPSYSVFNKKESLILFDELQYYSTDFMWGDENSNVTITPFFMLSVEASLEYEFLLAYPNDVKPGSNFNTYLKVVNPELTLTIQFQLGVDYTFISEESYYEGGVTVFDENEKKSLPISFGIFRIDLRDISEQIETLCHYEIETSDIFPSLISWLANFKFELDFIPIVKIMNLLTFDISGTNCVSEFASLTVTTDSMYVIPCTASSTATGLDDATIILDNFRIESAVGFELYCQMTFSGKILGFTIGPVDVNRWLYDYFGILIPYVDIWLLSTTLHIAGTENIAVPLNPLGLSAKIASMFYSLDNITYVFEVRDSNGNLVSGASVQVVDHSQTYYGSEQSPGLYEVVMDYYDLPEIIGVTVTKAGYITLATSFSLYVDPPAVTKGPIWEYTAISIGVIAVVATVITTLILKLRRRNV